MAINFRDSIEHAVMVLMGEKAGLVEGRKKFEPGGNLYSLIEKESPAAIERVARIDLEIEQLAKAIAYLEQEL